MGYLLLAQYAGLLGLRIRYWIIIIIVILIIIGLMYFVSNRNR